MPHCVIECSDSIGFKIELDRLVRAVHNAAETTRLFTAGDVKARLITYHHDLVGGAKDDYVHVTVGLLSGRSASQKKALSNAIVRAICELLPTVHFISVDVREFCSETYANRATLAEPLADAGAA